jgi:hypothetical protein
MLQQYITEVLFKQQSCSVPQVGTFTIQHIPAHFSVVDQVLTPPRQQVNFDTRWEDDGSCLHWISQKENLVDAVAALKLDKYLQQFRESLQTGQPIDLPGVGSLRLDPFGQIRFTPQELPDAWQPISLQQVLRPESAPKVLQGTTEVVNHEVVEHMSAIPEEFESQGRFRWWWVIVPLLVIAGGVAVYLLKDEWQSASLVPAEKDTSNRQAIAPAVTDSLPPVETEPLSDSISYFVVFQTFRTQAEAQKMYEKRIRWEQLEVVMYTAKDSATYNLAVPFRTLPADTTMAKDSVEHRFKVPKSAIRIEE